MSRPCPKRMALMMLRTHHMKRTFRLEETTSNSSSFQNLFHQISERIGNFTDRITGRKRMSGGQNYGTRYEGERGSWLVKKEVGSGGSEGPSIQSEQSLLSRSKWTSLVTTSSMEKKKGNSGMRMAGLTPMCAMPLGVVLHLRLNPMKKGSRHAQGEGARTAVPVSDGVTRSSQRQSRTVISPR